MPPVVPVLFWRKWSKTKGPPFRTLSIKKPGEKVKRVPPCYHFIWLVLFLHFWNFEPPMLLGYFWVNFGSFWGQKPEFSEFQHKNFWMDLELFWPFRGPKFVWKRAKKCYWTTRHLIGGVLTTFRIFLGQFWVILWSKIRVFRISANHFLNGFMAFLAILGPRICLKMCKKNDSIKICGGHEMFRPLLECFWVIFGIQSI